MEVDDSKSALGVGVNTNSTSHKVDIKDGAALPAHDLSPTSFAEKRYDPETLEIDYVAEKKLVRKLDLFIVPPVMLLYLFVCAATSI